MVLWGRGTDEDITMVLALQEPQRVTDTQYVGVMRISYGVAGKHWFLLRKKNSIPH